MLSDYGPLQLHPLSAGANLIRPDPGISRHLKVNDPAIDVMTDLRHTIAVTVGPDIPIHMAEERMRHRGVRMLFVIDEAGTLAGLITATDLLGEKPLQFIEQHGGVRSDIRVADVMTPRQRLEVLMLPEVLNARIGHIVATLKACGRQHALVVDVVDGTDTVCGLFSATQIARRLGMPINITSVARTFAEIEQELVH